MSINFRGLQSRKQPQSRSHRSGAHDSPRSVSYIDDARHFNATIPLSRRQLSSIGFCCTVISDGIEGGSNIGKKKDSNCLVTRGSVSSRMIATNVLAWTVGTSAYQKAGYMNSQRSEMQRALQRRQCLRRRQCDLFLLYFLPFFAHGQSQDGASRYLYRPRLSLC